MTRTRIAVAIGVLLCCVGCGHHARTMSVVVGGTVERVPAGSTVAKAAETLGLEPRAGNLLDVKGSVLRAQAFPGRLELNGVDAPGSLRLHEGDHIDLVAGRDRVERVERVVHAVPGGVFGDPQSRLEHVPGVQVIVRGAISHKLVSSRFRITEGPITTERAVALTFDDGPWPQSSLQILKILRRMHVHATFFEIGYLVDAYPDIVRAEHAAGMTIGNHTYNHPQVPPFDELPTRLADDEIRLAARSLERIGITPRLFRPPAGSASPQVVATAEAAGERVVLWSVDALDWPAGTTASEIRQRVLSTVQPGSIVDMHDGGGDRSATVAALPGIIKGIRHRHLRLVALTP